MFLEQPDNALQIPSLDFVKELCYTHLQTANEMESSFNRQRSQSQQSTSSNCTYAQKIQERQNKKLESIESTKSDFAKYIGFPISSESPMEFWKRTKAEFPNLYEKAKEILCKPATSGLVERLFSLIADINTADRVNLNVKTIEEIVMYKEFINLPKTYKEATKNIFCPSDEQLIALVKKLSVKQTDKKKPSPPRKKRSSKKRSVTSAWN